MHKGLIAGLMLGSAAFLLGQNQPADPPNRARFPVWPSMVIRLSRCGKYGSFYAWFPPRELPIPWSRLGLAGSGPLPMQPEHLGFRTSSLALTQQLWDETDTLLHGKTYGKLLR